MKFQIMAGASAAALLFAGAAFAQTSDPASQTTQQTAEASSAASVVDQIGDDNVASVNQINTGNSSVILQTGASTVSPSYGPFTSATVNQVGTNGRALTVQNSGNETSVTNQSGTNETAFTYQNGLIANATINQDTTDKSQGGGNVLGVNDRSSVSGALSDVSYAESLVGSTLDAWTQNKGSYGATIVQDDPNAYATSTATIDQSNSGSRGNNAALVTQFNDNYVTATIEQVDTAKSGAAILQTGSSDFSTAGIYQFGGTNNSATVQQTGGNYAAASLGNIYQNGSDQEGRVSQGGSLGGNTANVVQTSTDDGAFARVAQNGGTEVALTYQAGPGSDYAVTTQNDVGSTANTYQTGGTDYSSITQNVGGGANTANVYQSAAGAWSSVTQMGTNNTATVNQYAAAAPVSSALK